MTVEDVFNATMALIDEYTEAGLDVESTAEYKEKTPPILSMLQAELIGIENRYRKSDEQIFPIALTEIEQPLQIDDIKAFTLLENGLAAYLMLNEDKALANFFEQRYEEMKAYFLKPTPRAPESKKDIYGADLTY